MDKTAAAEELSRLKKAINKTSSEKLKRDYGKRIKTLQKLIRYAEN